MKRWGVWIKRRAMFVVCLVLGHRWVYEDTGPISERWDGPSIEADRYYCPRCEQHLFLRGGSHVA